MRPPASVHRLSRQAMGTLFEVFAAGEDEAYAGQAAQAAFSEVDRLERLFSRFDPGSEIGRANRLRPGEELAIGPETYECLALAEKARKETGGAFDVNARAKNSYLLTAVGGRFLIRRPPEDPSGSLGLDLDLGGIGKGYALDRALEILKEWGLENVLLHGGTSTALAMGSAPLEENSETENTGTHTLSVLKSVQLSYVSPYLKGWPVGAGGGWPETPGQVLLAGRALSGSGKEVKGQHILDPRTGLPAQGHLAAWASHPSAALADAYSTAFLVMDAAEVEDFCRRHPEVWACAVAGYGSVRIFNPGLLA